MAFVKYGESMPVQGYYIGDTTKEEICDQCGHTLVVVAVKGHNANLICKTCDIDEGLDVK